MTGIDENAKLLSEFGLTPYESKVYLTVFQQGLITAADISKVARIRREEVYRTLPKLEKIGLIERVLGRPARVRALPIEDALSILINRKEEETSREISNLLAKRDIILESVDKIKPEITEVKEKAHFTLVTEKDALEKRIASLIGHSTKSIEFADSFEKTFRFVLTFAEELLNATQRGVSVRIVTEYPDNAKLIPDSLKKYVPETSFHIKYCEDLSGNYIIYDGTQALITTAIGSTQPAGGTLWTDDISLINIVESDFNKLLQNSIDWMDLTETSDEHLKRILKSLGPRDHAILFYESLEAKRATLFNYIKRGLDEGEVGVYVCSEESPEEIRKAMNEFGLNVRKLEKSGALRILPYTELYIRDGVFDIDFIMDSWNKWYEAAISKGFSGMRATGEMCCFIEHGMVNDLIEYEHALHTVLEMPMTAICAYNADKLTCVDNPVDIYSELVKAHGKVLFAGRNSSIGRFEVRAS
jgi:sugar-specific transcriptional regulator TrmB